MRGREKNIKAKESDLSFHSNSVLPRPLASCGLVPGAVGLVDVRDFGHQRIVRVGVCEHRANGEQHFRDGQSRAPLVSQDVQTDAAVGVDVGVVDASGEVDLGRLEGVVGREVNGKEEDTARVWGVTRTHDSRLPVEQVISNGTSGAGRGWIPRGGLES